MSAAERQARSRAGKRQRSKLNHIRRRVAEFGELDLDALSFSLEAAGQFLADRDPLAVMAREDT